MSDDMVRDDLADTEQALRRALAADAARVHPPDRLGAILREAHEPRRTGVDEEPFGDPPSVRRTWLAASAAAAAVVAAVAVGAVVADRGGPPRPGSLATGTTPTAPVPATSATGGTTGTTGTTAPTPSTAGPTALGTVALPVYYVGRRAGQASAAALVREFVPVRLGSSDTPVVRIEQALDRCLAPAPGTPYAAVGPGRVSATVSSSSASGIEVLLSSDTGAVVLTPVQEAALTYTAQAAAGRGDVPVTIDLDPHAFGPPKRVGPFTRADFGDAVLAPIWVDAPFRGQVLPVGRPVTVTGLASVFEAQFSWEVRNGSVVVASGPARASAAAPTRSAFTISVGPLPAGSYTLRLVEPSPAGDGSLAAEVSTTFTVG